VTGSTTSRSVKILSITGWCRNGSTILGNVLGEVPGVFHVGELHFLWKNASGRGANSRCGCGAEVSNCPFWSQILPVGRPHGISADDWAETVIRRQHACVRTRHTWRVLRDGLRGGDIRAHATLMSSIYRAIAELAGARLIVETNKIPGETALLPRLPGLSPSYVHLVRDPRAVAHSWSRPKDYCYVLSPGKSTAYWRGFNAAAQAVTRRYPQRSMFLRYEDFIADPARTVEALLRLCGIGPVPNPVRDSVVELHTNHTVTGNPDRFLTGPRVIRGHDDLWRSGLSVPAKLAVLSLSWPQFRRYGYRYRGTFQSGTKAAASPPQQPAGRR
jgi:Sulfotransferase family